MVLEEDASVYNRIVGEGTGLQHPCSTTRLTDDKGNVLARVAFAGTPAFKFLV